MRRTSLAIPDATLDKQRIVDSLIQRVTSDATGESEPPLERYRGTAPSSRFWLGLLATEEEIEAAETVPSVFDDTTRFRPAAQGFSFQVKDLPARLDVEVSFAVWIALHPSLEEQQRELGEQPEETAQDNKVELAKIWTKVPVGPLKIGVELEAGQAESSEPMHVGAEKIRAAVREAIRSLPDGTVLHRSLRSPGGEKPYESDIREGSWEAWERENLADEARPEWIAEVDVDVVPAQDAFEVLLTVVNRSPHPDKQYTDSSNTRNFVRWACDTNLYEVTLSAKIDGQLAPYILEQIPESFRYDREVPALGWNAAVSWEANTLRTDFAARASTERIYPRTSVTDPGTGVHVEFESLASDPVPALRELVAKAHEWVSEAWSDEALEALAVEKGWEDDALEAARVESEEARLEISWVEAGLDALETDADALEAFKLMNLTMQNAAAGKYVSWHPFQIAFILGCIPGLMQPDSDEHVDILWFPTGGGKTEAYLGLNAFYLFLQRLKGFTGGTNTWARFPLRLLSLQQTQRFASSVLHAEMVRKSTPRVEKGRPFSVGYLVGSGNTPNKIDLPESRYYKGWDPDEKAETCRVLELCPGCGERPEVRFERRDHTLEHVCLTEGCSLEGRLPVYVIDDDIYRRAPSVLVGTVDKVTQISWNNGFRHLLGRAYGECRIHGLSNKQGRCGVFPCDEPLQPVPESLTGIGLEILDEMHLLSEELGSLDGNYETLFHSIAEELGLPQIKVVGATATIEGYKEQSDHLFRREPRRFPLPGPDKAESFWAFENPADPLRSFLAVLPRGTTMLNAAFWVTRSHLLFIEKALEDVDSFCGKLGIPEERADEIEKYLRRLYGIATTYALRRQELTRYRRDVTEDRSLVPEHTWAEITGDVDFWDVRQTLNRFDSVDEEDEVRVLGATSAISHGVDVDRLNVMCVMGMPNQVSEFIQATARVGRTHPGAVFCLVNPYRRRDVSHFRYFNKWAEYLDRLVERVPVNRESLPVLDLVLPGGFMAWLLQVDEPDWLAGSTRKNRRKRLWKAQETSRAITAGHLTESPVSHRLRESFEIPPDDDRFALHREYIDRFTDKIFQDLQLAGGDSGVPDVLAQADYPVPTSLRDVEKTIKIRGER